MRTFVHLLLVVVCVISAASVAVGEPPKACDAVVAVPPPCCNAAETVVVSPCGPVQCPGQICVPPKKVIVEETTVTTRTVCGERVGVLGAGRAVVRGAVRLPFAMVKGVVNRVQARRDARRAARGGSCCG